MVEISMKNKNHPNKNTTGQNIKRSAILEHHTNRGYFPFPKSENRDPFFSLQMPGEPLSMLVTTCRKLPPFHAFRKKGFRKREANKKSALLHLKQRFSCSYSSFMLWFYSLVCCCCCCCCCRSCAALGVLLWPCCSGCVVPVVLFFLLNYIID